MYVHNTKDLKVQPPITNSFTIAIRLHCCGIICKWEWKYFLLFGIYPTNFPLLSFSIYQRKACTRFSENKAVFSTFVEREVNSIPYGYHLCHHHHLQHVGTPKLTKPIPAATTTENVFKRETWSESVTDTKPIIKLIRSYFEVGWAWFSDNYRVYKLSR
jgi:hypothetical protein